MSVKKALDSDLGAVLPQEGVIVAKILREWSERVGGEVNLEALGQDYGVEEWLFPGSRTMLLRGETANQERGKAFATE